jgi:hypothetical protein
MTEQVKRSSKTGQNIIIGLVILLAIVHQDFWFWDSNTQVLGFMPIGLAYHAFYSLLAAALWVLAIKIAWPHDLERLAEDTPAANQTKDGTDIHEADSSDGVGEV